jgi:hypothetical protein
LSDALHVEVDEVLHPLALPRPLSAALLYGIESIVDAGAEDGVARSAGRVPSAEALEEISPMV